MPKTLVVLFATLVVVLANLVAHLVSCVPAQQSGEQNSLGQAQDSFGADYLALDDGLTMGRPGGSGGYSNKRARKMSAFVPMRGRKDGRDEQLASETNNELPGYLVPLRESDGADASILRLVGTLPAPNGLGAGQIHWTGAPPQFANQFAAQHLLAIAANMARNAPPRPLVGGEQEVGGGEPAPSSIMEAKLRRAFHPMRGKKSADASSVGSMNRLQESEWTLLPDD